MKLTDKQKMAVKAAALALAGAFLEKFVGPIGFAMDFLLAYF